MSRNIGTFNFAANFEVLAKAPLDAKMLVGTKADLTIPGTWEDTNSNIWLFDGAIVSVSQDPSTENNGIYFLKDADNYTNIDNWVLAGSGSQGDSSLGFINVGDGSAGVFAGIDSSGNVQFRTISGSGPIVVSQSGNTIVISYDGSTGGAINGGVWFSDMDPQNVTDNVGNKVFSSDGRVLDSCQTSTQDVTLSILALPGDTNYKPVITIGSNNVTISELSDRPVFTGTIDLSLNSVSILRVDHEDGASDILNITYDTPPSIQTAIFTGGYPGSQTELKENDIYSVRITTDINIIAYEIQNYGALKVVSETAVSSTNDFIINNLLIDDEGDSTQDLGFRIRVKKSTGTWSDWFTSSDAGSVDGTNTVKLNNTYPSVSVGSVTYPATQQALKASESATVSNTVTNANTYSYTSPGSQLNITNSTTYETSKSVTRNGGTYNISSNNFTLSATRTANNATSSDSGVIWIADTNATIAISSPSRMISGGNDGTTIGAHTVTITSTQRLLTTASVTLANVANAGAWASSSTFSTSNYITYNNTLNVDDDDDKGTFTWVAFTATNLAGQTVSSNTGQTQYILGGFKSRTVNVLAFGTSVQINVEVSDYSKVANTLAWSFKSLPTKRAVGTTATPDANAWAIDQLDNNPTTINILDTAAASSSSVASTITIEETI